MPPALLASSPAIPTLADLLGRLGGVPADRVRYYPLPGTAVEQDVLDIQAHEDRLCELIDGVLVEKPLGFYESLLAGYILTALNIFVLPRKLGFVSGADGMMRILPGRIRIPDVAFIARARLPGGRPPPGPVPDLYPDLAVEVLSESNTIAEMAQKRAEYFASGTRLVWIVDPAARTVDVYTPADPHRPAATLGPPDALTGGDVLPGFALDLASLFAILDD